MPRRTRIWLHRRKEKQHYLSGADAELGYAIRHMAWFSAWGKWYAAQSLAINDHKPITDWNLMHTAASVVLDAVENDKLQVRGRKPGRLDYEPIPAEHWRSSGFHMIGDKSSIWKLKLIPRGGAEITQEGEIIGRHAPSIERTNKLAEFDSLIVDSAQFEGLWPRQDRDTDAARKELLKTAKKAGADPADIKVFSGN